MTILAQNPVPFMKETTSFPLALLPRSPEMGATDWLYASLREAILGGQLHPGDRLPSTRDLAAQTGVSRGTVVAAFELLQVEGYVEGKTGAGTFVRTTLPDDFLSTARQQHDAEFPAKARPGRRSRDPSGARLAGPRRLSSILRSVGELRPYASDPPRAFRANQPDVRLFPADVWRRLTGRRLRGSMNLMLDSDVAGFSPLRQAVAGYLRSARGVRCETHQVVIVSGAQEAMDLLCRVLLDPGDRVAVESPGYSGARRVLAAHASSVVDIQVDNEGMTVPEVDDLRLIYVTPSHQYPLGMAMPVSRRMALIEWARLRDALIVEDDYDSEFWYTGRPLPAMQGIDTAGVVTLIGSFSKVLVPGLRLGYVVLPEDLVEPFIAIKSVVARYAPPLAQAVLADFIEQGHFARHLRRVREVYAGRRAVLVEEVEKRLSGAVRLADSVPAGLQMLAWLDSGTDPYEVARAASRWQVEVTPHNGLDDASPHLGALQLGFGAVGEGEIRRGVERLTRVLS